MQHENINSRNFVEFILNVCTYVEHKRKEDYIFIYYNLKFYLKCT